MDTLIYIGQIVGAIVIIAGFIGSCWRIVRKISNLTNKIEDLLQKDAVYKKEFTEIKKTESQIRKDFIEKEKDRDEDAKARKDLLLSIARRDLLRSFYEIVKKKYMTMEEFTVVQKLYDSYVNNGGNSVIIGMWSKIKNFKIMNDPEE